MADNEKVLVEFVQLVIERRIREADVTDGSKVPHGSEKHIKDLEIRIDDLSRWRDRSAKGSDARANYARVVNRLKAELKSARRTAEKTKKVKK